MPFIIRYPKTIPQGHVNTAILENIDFAPTLIDLGGGTVPDIMQGVSFKSILNTGRTPKDWKKQPITTIHFTWLITTIRPT